MGNLIRHADTSIPGLPSDVAGADVPRELEPIIDEILTSLPQYSLNKGIVSGGTDFTVEEHYAYYPELREAKDLLMQKLCSYCVSLQHVALLEGQKRRNTR